MLHTNYQGHLLIGAGEDFERFLPYMGMVAYLKICYNWPSGFRGSRCLKLS